LRFVAAALVAAYHCALQLQPYSPVPPIAQLGAFALLWANLHNGILTTHHYGDRRLIYWGVPAAGIVLVSVFIEKQCGWQPIALLRVLVMRPIQSTCRIFSQSES
jgi:hypothetical protein